MNRIGALVAFVLLVGTGILALRLAMGIPGGELSGGIPFLPEALNQAVGRTFMGFSGLVCLALAWLALRDIRQPRA